MQEPMNSRFAELSLILSGFINFWITGYCFSYPSPVIPVFEKMYNATYTSRYNSSMPEGIWTLLLTLTTSTIIAGGLLSGTTSKYWLKFLSKKQLLQLSQIVNIFSAVVLSLVGCLTWSYEAMIVGRFLTGISAGISYSVVPAMTAELGARPKQSFWQCVSGIGLLFGSFCGPVLAHPQVLGSISGLPAIFAIAAVPSVAYLIASFWLSNTPYYWLRKGDEMQALTILRKLRKNNQTECRNEIEVMKKEMANKSIIGIKEMLAVKQYRKQFFAVVVLFSNYILTGIDNIVLYGVLVLQQAGIAAEISPSVTIGIFALQFVSSFFGMKLIEWFGGLKTNIAGSLLIILAYILFTISQALLLRAPTAMPILSVVAIGVFVFGWSAGPNVATFVLMGELTIEPTRPTAFGYGAFALWFLSWAVGFVSPYLQVNFGPFSMLIWLASTIAFLVYQVFFIPETKGKSLEEIQATFK